MSTNWSGFSDREAETIRTIAFPISAGFSLREAAKRAGVSPREAEARLEELRKTIEAMRHAEAC